MKNFIPSFLVFCILFPLTSVAQDTCRITKEIDQFDGKMKASMPFFIIDRSRGNLFCTANRTPNRFLIQFSFSDPGSPICFKPGAKAIILFTDQSKFEVFHSTELNCDGIFHVDASISKGIFTSKAPQMNSICNKVIKAIRFYSTDGYLDVEFGVGGLGLENQAESFQRNLLCLRNTY